MANLIRPLLLGLCVCVLSASCGGPKGPPRKETFPVKGQVLVDGKPASGVAVFCTDVKGVDTKTPPSSAMTKDDGSFEIATYQQADGIPAGDYVLTFKWQKFNAISMSYGGPDKLNDRYADAKASQVRIKVEKGKETPPQKVELTTK